MLEQQYTGWIGKLMEGEEIDGDAMKIYILNRVDARGNREYDGYTCVE